MACSRSSLSTLRKAGRTVVRNPPGPLPSSRRNFSIRTPSRMGEESLICRADWGSGSNRFPSAPRWVSRDMINASRMASTGGLVTWAKSCLK